MWPENRNVEIVTDILANMMAEVGCKHFPTWATHNRQSTLVKACGFQTWEKCVFPMSTKVESLVGLDICLLVNPLPFLGVAFSVNCLCFYYLTMHLWNSLSWDRRAWKLVVPSKFRPMTIVLVPAIPLPLALQLGLGWYSV